MGQFAAFAQDVPLAVKWTERAYALAPDPDKAAFLARLYYSRLVDEMAAERLSLAKRELAKVPFLGNYMRRMGMVLVDRADPRRAKATVGRAEDLLAAGKSVISFPEGTRSRDGRCSGRASRAGCGKTRGARIS